MLLTYEYEGKRKFSWCLRLKKKSYLPWSWLRTVRPAVTSRFDHMLLTLSTSIPPLPSFHVLAKLRWFQFRYGTSPYCWFVSCIAAPAEKAENWTWSGKSKYMSRNLTVSIGLDLIDYECTAININKPNSLYIESMTIFFSAQR